MSLLARLVNYRNGPRVFHGKAVEELQRVTRGTSYEPAAYPMPSPEKAQLPAKALAEIKLSVRPGVYVTGFSGSSSEPDGFDVQIVDDRHSDPFFQRPVSWKNATVQGNLPTGAPMRLFLLPAPRLVIEPGQLRIQLKNLSANPNTIQFVVFTAEPPR